MSGGVSKSRPVINLATNNTKGKLMKKLIITHGEYGHIELAENDVVAEGKFKGLNQKDMFEKIMNEGYGGKVPAIFHAEFSDGSTKVFRGKDAGELIGRTDVEACTIIAPICGG